MKTFDEFELVTIHQNLALQKNSEKTFTSISYKANSSCPAHYVSSCLNLSSFILHHTTSYYIILHHSDHTTSYYIILHHTTSYYYSRDPLLYSANHFLMDYYYTVTMSTKPLMRLLLAVATVAGPAVFTEECRAILYHCMFI